MAYEIPLKEPKRLAQHKEFFFDEYNYYFNEREKIKKEISFALNDKVVSYPFTDWFRLASTKYAMDPLSCKGSVEHATGGRFNIGSINKDRFPTFPALYVGNEKETCIKEIYPGVEGFLQNKRGEGFFRVDVYLDSVLDLTEKGSLNKFVKTIKQIAVSKSLQNRAKKLGLEERHSVRTITSLKKEIYAVNWRGEPNIFDIPSSSQIFGQLVKNAGIEAILYRSTKTSKKGLCLAVFPENFENSDSYIELQDVSDSISNTRMDSKTFENFY